MSDIVRIEKMSYGVDAISHLENGKTVFVTGGVPEDLAKIEVYEEKSTFARARVTEILEPSKYRVAPFAPALMDSLSPWECLNSAAQLSAKQDNVRSALIRVGKMEADGVDALLNKIVPASREWSYRNKIELAAGVDPAGRLVLGFRQHATEKLQVVDSCAMALPAIEKSPKALTGALRYLSGREDLGIYRVGVRAALNRKSIEVALWTPPSSFPRTFAAKAIQDAVGATSVVRVIAEEGRARKVKRVEVLDGQGFWTERMQGCTFSVSAPSFFQVNTSQAEILIQKVLEGIGPVEGLLVVDLYAGVGAFSIPLAKAGAEVVAIELAGSSTKDLDRNAQRNNVDVEIICDDVARVLPEIDEADAVVVDPPRAGLDRAVVDQLIELQAPVIAYVSCDPQTFARDAALLQMGGYELLSCTPVDMFPQTYHVETVNILRRRA